MNLFILDTDPTKCAEYHCDKHVVKMPTETAQMISFVYHDKDFWNNHLPECIMGFSKTHYKHPCSIWIRESLSNFKFACKLGIALYEEYQFRYNKPDKHQRCKNIFEFALQNPPDIQDKGLTPFALAMDDCFIKYDSAIQNYQEYYRIGKSHILNWTKRKRPYFL
jgi:hypothetical protein